jgi:RNA polymerase sigma-70 factor (ECF subfamily)
MHPQRLESFTQHRSLLFTLAQQMLGNAADAEDILQDAFMRWQKASDEEIRSPKAYLTTIVTRLCLNHLGRARVKREVAFGGAIPERFLSDGRVDPEDYTRLVESLASALHVLLESLSPVERAVFLLREVFDCEYDEIANIVGKSDENCRQILRRARERIAGRQVRFDVSAIHHEHAVQQFLQISRPGDWQALMNLVAEDSVLMCDGGDTLQPAPPPIRGRRQVCDFLQQRAGVLLPAGTVLKPAGVNGPATLIAYHDDQPKTAFILIPRNDRLKGVFIITCPVRLRGILIPQGFASPN